MKSLELKVNKKIYDRLLEILSQFSSEELIIVNKDRARQLYHFPNSKSRQGWLLSTIIIPLDGF